MPNQFQLTVQQWDIDKVIPYVNNTKKHPPEQIDKLASMIAEYGFDVPIVVDGDGVIIKGHGRLQAFKKLNALTVPVVVRNDLTPAQCKAARIADNKIAESEWDMDLLKIELEELTELDFDLDLTGFGDLDLGIEESNEGLTEENDVPETPAEPITKIGDVWLCGNHRVMCGDSTSIDAVDKLMNGVKADMVFTDPPYGMKKESSGVMNDNLNYDDLLEFNRQWIPLTFASTKANGSWYCWGIDEPLMDIYSAIIKPMIKNQQATFRNLITWDKGSGQGQNSELTRSYAVADEKCLFVMCGVQGFNNNSDNYFHGWDGIRDYLTSERNALGWNTDKIIQITGKTSASHYFSKSQWAFPTEEHYKAIQLAANSDAFKREYDDIKREYDDIKREYYETRAYFNNTHDNFNNVWHFNRHLRDGSEGGHATPKPIELCERAIKSSSEVGNVVLDVFGGSGSTLIACEKTNRTCYMMELDAGYCDVIVKRWQDFTGKKATLESTGEFFNG